ncbi:hypothetical protein ACLI1A_11660 [Flavobacterium sp. RHBU_3]|uniref:hypothetical protein n=1 Tax=Flavobacterium sp. RHBU_3 TaxID=3391184 RepID=UPI003984AC9C
MAININTIIDWFQSGEKPTEQQFADSWMSFWHKDDVIPQSSIEGLETALDEKAALEEFETHLIDENAHASQFTQKADKAETFKDITTLVVAGVYTVTADDLFKTLVYTGSNNVTVLLSSTVAAAAGSKITLTQQGTGRITFAVDGYTLNYSADESPTLYGAFSFAEAVITDATNLQVSLYGKLLPTYA